MNTFHRISRTILLAGSLCAAGAPLGRAAKITVTPDRSIDVAAAKLRPGDTLVLKRGDYRQSVTLNGLRGEAQRPITIRGEPGAVLFPTGRDGILLLGEDKSEYLVFAGLHVRGAPRAGMVINGSRHITIRDCIMQDNGVWGIQTILCDDVVVENCNLFGSKEQHGVYFSTTDRPTVRGCRIYDNAGCGIHCNGDLTEGGDGMITGATIVNNRIYGNGASGGAAINMDGVEFARVVNNLLFDNASGGITSFKGNGQRAGDGHVIAYNTVFIRARQGRFAVQVMGAVTNVTLEHNVLVAGRGPCLEVAAEAVPGLRSDGNLYFMRGTGNVLAIDGARMDLADWRTRTGHDLRSRTLNPEFQDPETTNFTLRAVLPDDLLPVGYDANRRL